MFVNICLSIVDDYEIRPFDDLLLVHLASHPLQYFFARDVVASHDPLNTYLLGSYNSNDLVDKAVGTRVKHKRALHPLQSAFLEVLEYGGVYNSIDGFGIAFRSK